jgi:hypothetical protein
MGRLSQHASSGETLGNENEFFSASFLCKYTFIHFHYGTGPANPLA